MSRIDSRSEAPARWRRPLGVALVLAVFGLIVGCSNEDANAEEKAAAAAKSDPAMSAIDEFIKANPVDKSRPRWRTKLKKPPLVKFDPKKTYYWKLDTNVGEVQFQLFDDVAPMHVSNTLYLTRLGYYDSLKFHRVIKGFMAQGGDPLGNGRGSPGYRFGGEFDPKVVHDSPGLLSMANAGPGTDGSQFFITFRPTPNLDNRHTIYGKVADEAGMETIRKMEALGRPSDPAPPLGPLFIKTATIVVK